MSAGWQMSSGGVLAVGFHWIIWHSCQTLMHKAPQVDTFRLAGFLNKYVYDCITLFVICLPNINRQKHRQSMDVNWRHLFKKYLRNSVHSIILYCQNTQLDWTNVWKGPQVDRCRLAVGLHQILWHLCQTFMHEAPQVDTFWLVGFLNKF
jgi:hypothetical protein